MTEPVWIEKPECLALHSMVLVRFGGRDGILEEGLLESGLNHPHNLFAMASRLILTLRLFTHPAYFIY